MKAQDPNSVEDVNGLAVGDSIDNFATQTYEQGQLSLDELLNKNEYAIVVFYRGQWCPVCNKHLSALNDNYASIKELNAQVLAISPEKPDYQSETKSKTGAEFVLGFDKDYKIAKLFDVLYKPNAAKRSMYNIALGAKLKKAHSDDSQRLPVPATFIINADKEIIWRHFDRNYKNRSSVEAILKALKNA
ncbi:MAG: peroxiredoxin family protein [Psychroflexus sp.]|nr:peroxiredoxin family protein [Psychroflexus sp.]